ncbi:SDR family oxidoreductase [Microbispora catharanthi]|uniref:SDR family oxidoreductase n=1 Tax=Microbispora catharanthi TaxID=1712871 RepID=A0A5N6BDR6_9ACTN|nr:SDR family oxidoreductase [Microbispora catharanthi]KAB8178278.1 SDR family oxidoreductase [Microbispora catharanthi]
MDVAATPGLDGRVALVTGATRGLGLAIARKLCASGCHVYLNYAHSDDDAERAVELLSGSKGTATALKFDAAEPDVAPKLLEAVRERHPQLDVFVHNAASFHPMSAVEPQVGDFWDDVRLAVSPLVQAAARLGETMTPGTGRIIAISSMGARSVVPDYVSQGVGKAALESLVRYLAVELAPKGIAVNAVSTGKLDKGAGGPDAPAVRALAARTPAGRLTRPEDVADVVALLCTDEAAWIHGQVITADGGLSIRA